MMLWFQLHSANVQTVLFPTQAQPSQLRVFCWCVCIPFVRSASMMDVYDQIKVIQVSQTFHNLIQMQAALVLDDRKKNVPLQPCPAFCFDNLTHGPAFIGFDWSHIYITNPGPRSHFAKTILLYIVVTYLWGGHPCTYCPNLSSKFYHLTAKQPSNSLRFLHYKLVTEHSFKIAGKFFLYPVVLRAY